MFRLKGVEKWKTAVKWINHIEAPTGGVLKKLFLEISQYSLENTCIGVSF